MPPTTFSLFPDAVVSPFVSPMPLLLLTTCNQNAPRQDGEKNFWPTSAMPCLAMTRATCYVRTYVRTLYFTAQEQGAAAARPFPLSHRPCFRVRSTLHGVLSPFSFPFLSFFLFLARAQPRHSLTEWMGVTAKRRRRKRMTLYFRTNTVESSAKTFCNRAPGKEKNPRAILFHFI